MTSRDQIAGFEKLLQDAALLPEHEPPRRTLLQILGVGDKETRISRLLQFYLDPNNVHGLGDLLIRSLLAAAGRDDLGEDVVIDSVEREVRTTRGNRIDLLVEADDFVCCIENKLFAPLSNDAGDYEKYAEQTADERSVICVLLSLKEYDELEDVDWSGFIRVTYEMLFSEVESRLGHYATDAPPTYLLFLLDMIRSIQLLGDTEMDWDPTFVDFLEDGTRRDRVNDLLERIEALKTEMRNRVEGVEDRVRAIGGERWETKVEQLKPSHYRKVHPFAFFDSVVYHDIAIGAEGSIALGVRITLDGWRFRVRAQQGTSLSDVREILSDGELTIEYHPEETNRLLIDGGEGLPFDSSVEDVARATHEVLTKLLSGDESRH